LSAIEENRTNTMKLTQGSVSQLLAAFRSSEPTPGGGSAAALAGATGASLLAMVAGLPKPRASQSADLEKLKDAGVRATALAVRLESLIDEDSDAYAGVVEAFRLPKASDDEKAARSSAIQRALTAATEAPLTVMRHCAEALTLGAAAIELGNENAATDAQVGVGLLKAALQGAGANVEINLGSLKDAAYVARVRDEAGRLLAAAG
jgi:methenyltetrahydrofolate cyclohydrolase